MTKHCMTNSARLSLVDSTNISFVVHVSVSISTC